MNAEKRQEIKREDWNDYINESCPACHCDYPEQEEAIEKTEALMKAHDIKGRVFDICQDFIGIEKDMWEDGDEFCPISLGDIVISQRGGFTTQEEDEKAKREGQYIVSTGDNDFIFDSLVDSAIFAAYLHKSVIR